MANQELMKDAKVVDRSKAIIRTFIPRMMGVDAKYRVKVDVIIMNECKAGCQSKGSNELLLKRLAIDRPLGLFQNHGCVREPLQGNSLLLQVAAYFHLNTKRSN